MAYLKLQQDRLRPSVLKLVEGIAIPILIDTGSSSCMWLRGPKSFKTLFPEAYETKLCAYVNGLGQADATPYSVWIIPSFGLIDGITVHNLPIVVRDTNTYYRLLLSACFLQAGTWSFDRCSNIAYLNNVYRDFYGVAICSVVDHTLVEVRLTTCADHKLSTVSCNQMYALSRSLGKSYEEISAAVAVEGQGKVTGLNPEEVAIRYWPEYKKRHNIVL